jgi:glycerol-3-phosphate acyltransferase PlsY
MLLLLLVLIAYLIGSLSSAIIICKFMKLPDPRSQGSGNPGATNVLRMAGKKLAILVLLGDILKGVVAVLLAKFLGVSPHLLGWVALAVFLGHLFPIFFGFKGGKGVATAIGGIAILSWPLALLLLATWILAALIFRYSSLAALIATVLAPLYGYWLVDTGNYLSLVIICVLLLLRHHANIRNLWTGKESRLGERR